MRTVRWDKIESAYASGYRLFRCEYATNFAQFLHIHMIKGRSDRNTGAYVLTLQSIFWKVLLKILKMCEVQLKEIWQKSQEKSEM